MYLALASYRNDIGDRSIKSRVYRHSLASGKFEAVQEFSTTGAVDVEAFTVDSTVYLAVANHADTSTYEITSRIYTFSVPC